MYLSHVFQPFSMLAVIADFGYFLHRRVPLPLEPAVLGLELFQGRYGFRHHIFLAGIAGWLYPVNGATLYGRAFKPSNQLFNFHQGSSSPSGNLQWVGV